MNLLCTLCCLLPLVGAALQSGHNVPIVVKINWIAIRTGEYRRLPPRDSIIRGPFLIPRHVYARFRDYFMLYNVPPLPETIHAYLASNYGSRARQILGKFFHECLGSQRSPDEVMARMLQQVDYIEGLLAEIRADAGFAGLTEVVVDMVQYALCPPYWINNLFIATTTPAEFLLAMVPFIQTVKEGQPVVGSVASQNPFQILPIDCFREIALRCGASVVTLQFVCKFLSTQIDSFSLSPSTFWLANKYKTSRKQCLICMNLLHAITQNEDDRLSRQILRETPNIVSIINALERFNAQYHRDLTEDTEVMNLLMYLIDRDVIAGYRLQTIVAGRGRNLVSKTRAREILYAYGINAGLGNLPESLGDDAKWRTFRLA